VIAGSEELTGVPLMVARTVRAVPAVDPVKIEVYVPLLKSVTGLNVPLDVPDPVRLNATVEPPLVMLLPLASLAKSETAIVPFFTTMELERLTTDCAAEMEPVRTVIVGNVEVISFPLMFAEIERGVPALRPRKVSV
jgi:hypothetical protein